MARPSLPFSPSASALLTEAETLAIVFFGTNMISDPVALLVDPSANQAQIEAARVSLGLNKPIWFQFRTFVSHMAEGDFGKSFVFNRPVFDVIFERLPATLELAALMALIIGLPAGLYAGLYPERLGARVIMGGSIFGFSLPSFWVGIVLILVFSVTLGWFPATGSGDTTQILGVRWSFLTWDGLCHLFLPALNLSHTASFHSFERITPSNHGIKHLDRPVLVAYLVMITLMFVIINLIYVALAPRIKLGSVPDRTPDRTPDWTPDWAQAGMNMFSTSFHDKAAKFIAGPLAVAGDQRCQRPPAHRVQPETGAMTMTDTILQIKGLKTHFVLKDGVARAVDGFNLNRSRTDVDPVMVDGDPGFPLHPTKKSAAGMGVLRRQALPGVPVYAAPLPAAEVLHRLSTCYDPYFAALKRLLDATYAAFGQVVHIDCHSMKSHGNQMNDDPGMARPDVVVSDQDGCTADPALTARLAELFRQAGYSVKVNDPYKGGHLVDCFCDPANGYHGIQIELNRALYMDEAAFTKREAGFTDLRVDITRILRSFSATL